MKDYDFCLCTHWCISCHWLLHCMPHFKYHAIFLIKFHIKVMQKFFLFFVKKLLTKFLSHSIISNVSGTRQNTKQYARVAQLVEHDLAKVGAAGSSPVSRSGEKRYIAWCISFFRVLPDSNIRVSSLRSGRCLTASTGRWLLRSAPVRAEQINSICPCLMA